MSDSKTKPEAPLPAADRPDPRDRIPIFVHSEIDDLELSTNAFRVYGHLARRAGRDNIAWPSYATIAEHCFRPSYPKAKDSTLRRRAMEAVRELQEEGLIEAEHRFRGDQGHTSNAYRLLTLGERDERPVKSRKGRAGEAEAGGDEPEA